MRLVTPAILGAERETAGIRLEGSAYFSALDVIYNGGKGIKCSLSLFGC